MVDSIGDGPDEGRDCRRSNGDGPDVMFGDLESLRDSPDAGHDGPGVGRDGPDEGRDGRLDWRWSR